MKPLEFEISLSVESCDEKIDEIWRNDYDAEKCVVSKLSNISIQNFDSTTLSIESRFCEDY